MVSQVPFLRFAAEMYLGHPFSVVGMLPEKQMRAAGDDVGWVERSPLSAGARNRGLTANIAKGHLARKAARGLF